MKKRIFWALIVAGLASWSFAGHRYKATTTAWEEGARKKQVSEVEAWVEGLNAKIVYRRVDGGAPMVEEGAYLITTDGGRTVYLINPKDKTYMEYDVNQLIGAAGAIMQSMKGVVSMTFTDPRVKILEQGDGGVMFDMKTERTKVQTTYGMDTKVLGMRRYSDIEMIQEIWAAGELGDMALGLWLRKEPPRTGDEGLDKIIEADIKKIKGFPLKSKTQTVIKQYNKKRTKIRKQTTTYANMEVTEWSREPVPTPKIPPDYEQIMMPGGDEEGNPFKGLFKRKND